MSTHFREGNSQTLVKGLIIGSARAAALLFPILAGFSPLQAQSPQTIAFDPILNQILTNSPFPIAAQASSGLPVVVTSTTPAVCRNAGILVTLVSAGTCSLTASQSGNTNFSPATPVTQSFNVTQANPSGTFAPSANSPFPVGSSPQSLAVADFNNDGILDLASANSGGNTVTVLLGDGTGNFTAATNSPFAVGSDPLWIAAGDFNGDGFEDLAVANFNDGTVTVLLGDGTGNFTPAPNSPFAVGSGPASLAVGDFNCDGIQDLAVGNFSDSTVSILLGDGTGNFTPAAGSPFTVGTNPGSVVVADFNGDGFEDLATADYGSNDVTVLLGNGAAGFAPAAGSPFAAGMGAFASAVGDFNGDGIPDLAVANYSGNNVALLLGNGSGGFTQPTASPFAVGTNPYSLAVQDFNGDGIPDLAVANYGDSTVTILFGNGTGNFTPSAGGPFSVGTSPDSLATSDFNGDGIPDLATSNGGGNNVTVLLGGLAATISVLTTTSALTIPFGQSVPLSLAVSGTTPAYYAPTGTATFLDGTTVLGTASQNTSPYTFTAASLALGPHTLTAVYPGDTFSSPSTSNTITIQVEMPQTITFPPLSGMSFGTPPFSLTASASSGLTVTFTSNTPAICTVSMATVTLVTGGTCSITANQPGNSVYAPALPVTQTFSVTSGPQTITFDSISNTILGISPFAVAAESSAGLPVTFTSNTPAVCTAASVLVTLLSAGSCSLTASQPGNANFVAATPVTQSFSVAIAKASSGLTGAPASPFAVGSQPITVVASDFNGDGFPDLATANSVDNTVTVLLGNGTGGFTAAPGSPFAVGSSPDGLITGDFNGDGIPDLASANSGDDTVTVLLGNGSGGFTAASGSPFAVGSAPASLVVSDFNADGIQDLAIANLSDATLTVLLGNGSGGFTAAAGSPFATGMDPISVTSADFNADGIPDLAVANGGDNTVTVLLGDGAGGFTAASGSPFAVGGGPYSVVVGDFNKDGLPDLATSNSSANTITVLLGTGSGGFTAPPGSPFAVGTTPYSVVVGDFNGDGIPDLASANGGANTVTVLLGNGSGGFSQAAGSPFAVGSEPVSLAVGNFNGAGFLDIAVANYQGNSVSVLVGIGTTPQTITFSAIGGVTLGAAPFTLTATASSGLTVSFASTTTSVCTVAGDVVTLVALGVCSVTATQGGNSTYAAAAPVTQSFAVSAPAAPPPPPYFPPSSLSIVTSGKLPEIALGSAVSTTFMATAGTLPYTWSATSLPSPLALNPSTGALTGIPAQPGNDTFTIAVADSESPPATAGLIVTLSVLGIVSPSSASPPTALPAALQGKLYSQNFTAAGGSGTYSFSSSNAPPGLSFSGSMLTGIPATAGTTTFQVQVADGNIIASSSFTLVVTSALSVPSSYNPSEIAFGSNIAGTLTATGGKPPYSWSASNLPTGVTLNASSGVLGGSVAQPGNYTFTAQVADSETPPATKSLSVTLQVLGFTTSSALPSGSTTAAYSQTFTAAGGTGPYTFSSANAPPGLAFNGAVLSGTPATVGTFSFPVRVSDAGGFSTSANFSLTVTGPSSPLVVPGGALTNGQSGMPYSQTLTGTGGAPPYTWTVIAGSLPAGLGLNGPGGVISGTPSAPGTSAFTAQATDSSGASTTAVYNIVIAPQPLSLSGVVFPNGIVGSDYPVQIPAGSGGVGPYSLAISGGSPPPGLTLANGQIAGIPTTEGTFSFTIAVTDAEAPALTVSSPAQIVVSAANPGLILSTGSVSFNLAAGASGLPPAADVTVESSAAQQQLKYSVVPAPQASWLDVTTGGTTPGGIAVALDPSALNLGVSSAPLTTTLAVNCLAPSPCAGQSQTIAVSLSVTAPAPQLVFLTNLVQFTTSASSTAPPSQQIAVQNTGGGAAAIASISAADPWLTASSAPSAVPAGPPSAITLTANPAGLAAGFYRTTLTVQSSAGTIAVPVTLEIAALPTLTLSGAGALFQSTAGSAPLNTSGSFRIGVNGSGTLNWTATVQPGASWLQLNQFTTGGTVNSSTPATVDYTVNAAALTSAQTYYGAIQITAPGVTDSPLIYPIVVNVAPATSLPVPVPQPAGLVFQAVAGGSPPASQSVSVYGSSGSGTAYSASASTANGVSWLTVSPASGASSTGATVAGSTVSVNPGTLPAGVYTGTVSYQFTAAAVRTVNVTMIVVPGGAEAGTTGACTATQLVPTQTGLVNDFAQPAAWPATLSVGVANNCGAQVLNGQATATFSNGDPPLTLVMNPATGVYSGTWTPGAQSGQVTVTSTVTAPGFSSASTSITGAVLAGTAPLLAPAGTLHVYDPLVGGAVAPGTILQIYGSGFSQTTAQAINVPLPVSLAGTSLTVGGIPAPLYYVSPGQIDAQLPSELTPGNSYQLIVNSAGVPSMPGTIQIAAATPGVAAYAGGLVLAQHADYSLISETSPAKPGEYVVIYLAGLGATNHAVADGAAAPDSPLSMPLTAPALTLNGASVTVSFAGLTPGAVGLYQINFQVPANAPNGDLQLVVSQSGVSGNTTILPVHN